MVARTPPQNRNPSNKNRVSKQILPASALPIFRLFSSPWLLPWLSSICSSIVQLPSSIYGRQFVRSSYGEQLNAAPSQANCSPTFYNTGPRAKKLPRKRNVGYAKPSNYRHRSKCLWGSFSHHAINETNGAITPGLPDRYRCTWAYEAS